MIRKSLKLYMKRMQYNTDSHNALLNYTKEWYRYLYTNLWRYWLWQETTVRLLVAPGIVSDIELKIISLQKYYLL